MFIAFACFDLKVVNVAVDDVFGKPKPEHTDTVHRPIDHSFEWYLLPTSQTYNLSMCTLTLHCRCAVTLNHMQLDKCDNANIRVYSDINM